VQATNAAGQSWEGPAQWATLASLNVPTPPRPAVSWHDWGVSGVSSTGWLRVQVNDNLWLQVWG